MAGSVLQRQRPSKPMQSDDSFVFRVSCDLRFLAAEDLNIRKCFRLWISEIGPAPEDLLLHLGDTWQFQKIEGENLVRGFARIKGCVRALYRCCNPVGRNTKDKSGFWIQ